MANGKKQYTPKKAPRVDARTPQEKIADLREELCGLLVQRHREVEGLLVALLAREHVLLLGPPGTAKSYAVELLASAVDGAAYFYWLMSRFTVPEEMFGPFSLSGLKSDRFERITTGKLPEASLAFLDECFKANSSILNALLALMNERKFNNGFGAEDCPLETMVGASNELPESKELDALFDRFMLRYWTAYISDRGDVKTMLTLNGAGVQNRITVDELHEAQAQAAQVDVSDAMLEVLLDVKDAVEKAGWVVSDRRWRKCLAILKAAAYLNGRDAVNEDDMLILADVLWKEPKDRPELLRVVTKAANPLLSATTEILDAAREVFNAIPFKDEVSEERSAQVFQQVVEANMQFKASVKKLRELGDAACVDSAVGEIEEMSQEASRFAGRVSGLSL